MAGNMDFIGRLLAPYLTAKLGFPIDFTDGISWQERERRFDRGAIQILWICGLPYVQKASDPNAHVVLLAAPVMAGARYSGQPVYFSDIVVRSTSPYRRFDDLRGATWAYNEPNSHSGYTTIRYYLARRNERGDFFGRVIESGSHENSLDMILAGQIDGSAIDSTVLELEQMKRPALAGKLRILDTIGPSPIPPWLVDSRLSQEIQRELRQVFHNMHRDEEGRQILHRARFARFVPVSDRDYDHLRKMTAEAAAVEFPPIGRQR
jgi:phosphonate transport system substrate-binding protein